MECASPSCRTAGCPSEDRSAGELTHVVSYTHLDVCLVEDGRALGLLCHVDSAAGECECALWQLTDAEGPRVAHSSHKQQAHPSDWSPGRLGVNEQLKWNEQSLNALSLTSK